jgi:hypothetical protein
MTLDIIERWCHWELTLSPSLSCCTTCILQGWKFKSVWRVLDHLAWDTCSMWTCHLAEWRALLTRSTSSVILTVRLPSFLFCAEPVVGQRFTHDRTVVGASTRLLPRFPDFFRKARCKYTAANILTKQSPADTLCLVANVPLHNKPKATQCTVEP